MSDKIYCGSGRIIPTQYGDMTRISFHKDDINKMVAYMKEDGGDFINLTIKEKREPEEGKPTHYLEVDTWKPTKGGGDFKKKAVAKSATKPATKDAIAWGGEGENDLPF